ncbi:hypothetical protein B1H29_12700 [Streptomyces pactum]|uniref:Uncharacterized protein n=1 Tax=Streptomyces pactum TaxID=68249 RepID=A0A1S6J7B5_9ACTN|nr:hypothetical protein [Streptomyces pactum]AQS67667.1 hypothetical protein B1H29_12700 [Streptomyces pactum]
MHQSFHRVRGGTARSGRRLLADGYGYDFATAGHSTTCGYCAEVHIGTMSRTAPDDHSATTSHHTALGHRTTGHHTATLRRIAPSGLV